MDSPDGPESRIEADCPVCGADDAVLEYRESTADRRLWTCTECSLPVETRRDGDDRTTIAPPESRLRAGEVLRLEDPVGKTIWIRHESGDRFETYVREADPRSRDVRHTEDVGQIEGLLGAARIGDADLATWVSGAESPF